MTTNRREVLRSALLGTGWLGLRSIATGIPLWMLADPLNALAQEAPAGRSLILSTSGRGDPINGNVPGTYVDENVVHPLDPQMAETPMRLGAVQTSAAKPWAELPEGIRNRMTFIHHGTYTNSHPNHPKVLKLMGATNRNEMVVSALAKRVAGNLQTTQVEPVSLGSTVLSFEGRSLSRVPPRALKQVLGSPTGPVADLQELRDNDIDRIYALYREQGSERHRGLLDRFAQTRSEARTISESLLERLDTIESDGVEGQIQAAAILSAMNLAPVLTIRIDFGGDNHNDTDLAKETRETVSGVGHLRTLVETLDGLKAEGVLKHDVLVGSLNVFGRTLTIDRKQRRGRDHNSRHHATVLIGEGIKPSVVGGIVRGQREWEATGFNSNDGKMNPEGDIPYEETFPAVAKTIGHAMGIGNEALDEDIIGGKVIQAAVE